MTAPRFWTEVEEGILADVPPSAREQTLTQLKRVFGFRERDVAKAHTFLLEPCGPLHGKPIDKLKHGDGDAVVAWLKECPECPT